MPYFALSSSVTDGSIGKASSHSPFWFCLISLATLDGLFQRSGSYPNFSVIVTGNGKCAHTSAPLLVFF